MFNTIVTQQSSQIQEQTAQGQAMFVSFSQSEQEEQEVMEVTG